MQGLTLITLLALGGVTSASAVTAVNPAKVVKLLENIIVQSKAEAETERVLFAKYKCYCDSSTAERNAAMALGKENIAVLTAKIEALQGSTGELSSQVATLTEGLASTARDLSAAVSMYTKAEKACRLKKADLTNAIGQMNSAVSTLNSVGADQTAKTGADSSQFLAGFKNGKAAKASFLSVGSAVQSAVGQVQAFMSEKQYDAYTALVQAEGPGGTYTSQSGAVMGIIKNMRDTFESDLAETLKEEAVRVTAFRGRMELLTKDKQDKEALKKAAETKMGQNDISLTGAKGSLTVAKNAYKSDDEFLNGSTGQVKSAGLTATCTEKTADYETRKSLRVNEDAAVAQAVSILSSDSAFASFETTDSTKTAAAASFLQLSSSPDVRDVMQRLLHRAASEKGMHTTKRLNHVVSMLAAKNPFDVVLKEITAMIEVIKSEGAADATKAAWCNEERKENQADLRATGTSISTLEGKVLTNTLAIKRANTGFEAMIAKEEGNLLTNTQNQASQTTTRATENQAYQTDIKNLGAVQGLLSNAIKVLSNFYGEKDAKIEKAMLEEYSDATGKAPPATWANDSYNGQKGGSGGGSKAIEMLKFILTSTKAEETAAHKAESDSQAEFEDAMAIAKREETQDQKDLVGLKSNVASSSKALTSNTKLLKAAKKQQATTADYLVTIKPGCDFITSSLAKRKAGQQKEMDALKVAETKLKASPAYLAFETAQTSESYGKCKTPCVADKHHVKCKACMADVTETVTAPATRPPGAAQRS